MKNITKRFYAGKPWSEIITDPLYLLGSREIEGLERFLGEILHCLQDITLMVHLGIGSFREVPLLVNSLPSLRKYVVNDICENTVEKATAQGSETFPRIDFIEAPADIEVPGSIRRLSNLRENSSRDSTLVALTGNGVIFANHDIDTGIRDALMNPRNLFLLTLEERHENMFASYQIPSCYELLSQSGLDARPDNTEFSYDETDSCLKASCQGQVLLASYKPTAAQLRDRLSRTGLLEVAFMEYPDLHMLAGLFRRA
jgi:hypothetical protein